MIAMLPQFSPKRMNFAQSRSNVAQHYLDFRVVVLIPPPSCSVAEKKDPVLKFYVDNESTAQNIRLVVQKNFQFTILYQLKTTQI